MPEIRISGFKPLLNKIAITIPQEAIAQFCQKWKIQEFYLFGSVLRDDFRPDSDIDVMVEFTPDARWGLEIVSMKEELEEIFGRQVDFIFKEAIEKSQNWIRRAEIFRTAKLIYDQR